MCALCIQHSAESTWRPIRLLAQVDGEGIKVDWWMTDLALVSASGSVSVDLCLSLSFSLWCRHVFRWWLLCPTRGMVRGEDKSQGKVGMDEVYVRSIQVWKSRLWVWTVHLEDPHVVVAKTNLTSDLLWRTPRASLQIGSSGVWCWITSARIMITAAGWMGCDDVVEPRDARRVPRRVPCLFRYLCILSLWSEMGGVKEFQFVAQSIHIWATIKIYSVTVMNGVEGGEVKLVMSWTSTWLGWSEKLREQMSSYQLNLRLRYVCICSLQSNRLHHKGLTVQIEDRCIPLIIRVSGSIEPKDQG